MRSLPTAAVAIALLFVLIPSAGAQEPKPVINERSLLAADIAWYRGELVDAYKKVGKQDAKWDEPALAFLERMSVAMPCEDVSYIAHPNIDCSVPTLRKLADDAVNAGCDDPLVLYLQAYVIGQVDTPPFVKALSVAAPALLSSGYSDFVKFHAATRCVKAANVGGRKDLGELAKPALARHALAFLSVPSDDVFVRRRRCAIMLEALDFIGGYNAERRIELTDALAAEKKLDPWLVQMAVGLTEMRKLWEVHGNDPGDRGDADHAAAVKRARDAFAAAYEMEKGFPEGAAAMIRVAGHSFEGLNEDPREWFDRAVAAQPDYMPAWRNYLQAMHPRWEKDGTASLMYELGYEAAETGDFNTAVPFFLTEVLDSIAQFSARDGRTFYTDPNVWQHVSRVFEGYMKRPELESRLVSLRTQLFIHAYLSRAYLPALKTLESLSGEPRWTAFEQRGLDYASMVSEVRAMNSDQGHLLHLARTLESATDFPGATAVYLAALSRIDHSHIAFEFADVGARTCSIATKLARGPVEIPLNDNDDLRAWLEVQPGWKVEKPGQILFESDKAGTAVIYHRAPMPRQYRATFSFMPTYSKTGPRSYLAFVFTRLAGDRAIVFLGSKPRKVRVHTKRFMLAASEEVVDLTPDVWHTATIERLGGTVRCYINGEDKPIVETSSPILNTPYALLGLACDIGSEGGAMRVKDIKVERIKDRH